MTQTRSVAILVAAAAISAAPAAAAPAACAPGAYRYPPTLAAWAKPLKAAATAGSSPDKAIAVDPGPAVTLRLAPAATVRFARAPEKVSEPGRSAGLVAVTIGRAATYQVALSDGAWVDMLRDGRPVASTAHGHGPDCSGIRKLVSFPLTPGRYLLQISGAPAAMIGLMVVPAR